MDIVAARQLIGGFLNFEQLECGAELPLALMQPCKLNQNMQVARKGTDTTPKGVVLNRKLSFKYHK